jgi:uncharacterized membrane protein YbhN (UPF0104 family)
MAAMKWPTLLRRFALPGGLRPWVTLLSFGFLLAALLNNSTELLQQRLDLQGWLWLSLGAGVTLLSLVLNAAAWWLVLRQMGLRPRRAATVVAYLDTNQHRHLPGGVAHLAARLSLLQAPETPLQVPASSMPSLVAVILDPLLATIASIALVAVGGWQGGFGAVGLAPLLLLRPRWLQPLLAWLKHHTTNPLGLDPTDFEAPAVLASPWPALVAEFAVLLLRFAGFVCCLMAFELDASLDWGGWLAGFALACVAALVVPGAPAGLGVFEAVLLIRLGTVIPTAPLLAVALSYRGVMSLADGLAAFCARLDRGPQQAVHLPPP